MKNEKLRKILLSVYLVLGFISLGSYITANIMVSKSDAHVIPPVLLSFFVALFSAALYLFIVLYFKYPARNLFLLLVPFLGGMFFAALALRSKSETKDFRLEGKVWNIAVLLGFFALSQTTGSVFAFFSTDAKISIWQVVLDLSIFILTISYFIYWGRKRLDAWHLKNLWSGKWIILIGVASLLAWAYFWPFFVSLFNTAVPLGENEEQLRLIEESLPNWLMWIHVAIGAPIMEETIFRLGIYELISPKHRKLAFLISTVSFALLHLMNGSITDWRVWGVYLGMSVVLAGAYYKSNNVETPTAIHFLWNGTISFF